jgi:hypothetical protein
MSINESTGLAPEMGITDAMMACPMVRVPLLAAPQDFPEDIRDELQQCFDGAHRTWGSWPRYFQMLGHAPATVEAWILLDQKLRAAYLQKDPEYVGIEELVIIKTALITQCNN